MVRSRRHVSSSAAFISSMRKTLMKQWPSLKRFRRQSTGRSKFGPSWKSPDSPSNRCQKPERERGLVSSVALPSGRASDTRKFMANPFVHVELNTTDVEKAKSFYSRMFDWEMQDMDMGPSG